MDAYRREFVALLSLRRCSPKSLRPAPGQPEGPGLVIGTKVMPPFGLLARRMGIEERQSN